MLVAALSVAAAASGAAMIIIDLGSDARSERRARSSTEVSTQKTTDTSPTPTTSATTDIPTDTTTTDAPPESDTTATSKTTTSASTTRTTTDVAAGLTMDLSALRGMTVGIDAGHNGGNAAHASDVDKLVDAGTLRKPCDTSGTSEPGGTTEAEYTLDIALRLQRILKEAGVATVMVRTDNSSWGPCITERAAITNRSDVAISIHADGGTGPSSRGFHVIYPGQVDGFTDDIAADSYRLAVAIRDAYRQGTGLAYANYLGRNGLDERTDLGGLNLSDTPKVFIETGVMRNPAEMAKLNAPAFRQRIARSLAVGLARYAAAADSPSG